MTDKPKLPPFFAHLFGQEHLSREAFLSGGQLFEYAFVAEHADIMLQEVAGIFKLAEDAEAKAPEVLAAIRGDLRYLRMVIDMHSEALTALLAREEPADSYEAYLNGLYEFWLRFRRIASHLQQAFVKK